MSPRAPRAAARADHQLAVEVAETAGALLLALRAELAGSDPKFLRAEGDRRSHEFILDSLSRARPDDAVLSEEGADGAGRLSNSRVWIVDPLDGTREFAEAGRVDWAVHVALWADGCLTAGAVALPGRGMCLGTAEPPRVPPRGRQRPRLTVSRSRPPAVAEAVRLALDADVVPLGSAGAKVMSIVLGEADAYVHAGGQYEWDSAAPVAVAAAAGLHTSRLDGTSLAYNQPDPWLPDLVVCRPELADPVLHALAEATGGSPS